MPFKMRKIIFFPEKNNNKKSYLDLLPQTVNKYFFYLALVKLLPGDQWTASSSLPEVTVLCL